MPRVDKLGHQGEWRIVPATVMLCCTDPGLYCFHQRRTAMLSLAHEGKLERKGVKETMVKAKAKTKAFVSLFHCRDEKESKSTDAEAVMHWMDHISDGR